MTPGARAAAAISILDQVLAGEAAERALTRWARASRFAGSGDRAAIRDLVFDALRCRRSHLAASGQGEETGRALIIGGQVAAGRDPGAVLNGQGHAPAPLSGAEQAALATASPPDHWPDPVRFDIPDWLDPPLRASLGDDFVTNMTILRQRAPVFARANLGKTDRDGAIAALAADGVEAVPGPLAATALRLGKGATKLRATRAYAEGLVELQDAASQAVVAELPLRGCRRVLDYCAGGGGKVLAMAALHPQAAYTAHDADPRRMADLPARAARAGVTVALRDRAGLAEEPPFDLVVLDVPCSGSGSWRRAPEAKWRLTEARLAELQTIQAAILEEGARRVAPGGVLAYMTCSLLRSENRDQIDRFRAAHPEWRITAERRLTPADGGDGFYVAILAAPVDKSSLTSPIHQI